MCNQDTLKAFYRSFKDFLLTGTLGLLPSFPTRLEVEQLLGDPIAIDEKSGVVPNQMLYVLYYDNIQISYIGDDFFQLAIYFREYAQIQTVDDFPVELGVHWYKAVKALNYDLFKQFLHSEDISCRRVLSPYPMDQDGTTIEVTSTGIWLSFDGAPTYMIDSIYYTPSRPGDWQYEVVIS